MAAIENDIDVIDTVDTVAEFGPFLLTKTGAIATRDATFEEWEAATRWAQDAEKASPWWVADLLAYGEHRYGEKYAQAVQATGLSVGTLMNAVYVGRQIEASRRREALRFAHHQEVAGLPRDKQEEWLDRAVAQGLSQKKLRVQIQAAKAAAAGPTLEYRLTVTCNDVDDRTQLADRLRLEGRAVKMTDVKA